MTALHKLKAAINAWRRAERETDDALMRAKNPGGIEHLRHIEKQALADVRAIVDSEPWSDITQGI